MLDESEPLFQVSLSERRAGAAAREGSRSAEFRSTLAMEAVADLQADMSRKMADIRKNL